MACLEREWHDEKYDVSKFCEFYLDYSCHSPIRGIRDEESATLRRPWVEVTEPCRGDYRIISGRKICRGTTSASALSVLLTGLVSTSIVVKFREIG